MKKNKLLNIIAISIVALLLSSIFVTAWQPGTGIPGSGLQPSSPTTNPSTTATPNLPTYWDSLIDKTILEDSSTPRIIYSNIKSKCHDSDDPLIFSIKSTHVHYDLSYSGNNLLLVNLEPNYDKTEKVILDCNGVQASFNLIITPINDAPTIIGIPNKSINEDITPPTKWINLWNYANDIDNLDNTLTFSIKSQSNPSLISCYITSNRYLTCNAPALNQFGSSDIIIQVSDGEHRAEDSFTITVLSVNDAPIANNIISNTNEDTEIIITLDYNDIDTNDKAESCSILNIIDGTISQPCACNNGICTVGLTPLTNSVADISANYIVNDGDSDSNIATITVSINSIGDPAVWQTLSNQAIAEDSIDGTTIYANLKSLCTDIDSTVVITAISGSSNYELYMSSNDLKIKNLVTNYNGVETVNLDCNGIPNSFVLTILPVNDAPVVSDIPNQTIDEGSSFTQINLDDYVSDVDNQDSEITWTYTGNSELTVDITNRIATITIPNIDWYGSETITFRATDPNNLYDEDSATFIVTSVDDPAIWQMLENKAIDEDTAQTRIYPDLLLQCTDRDSPINMQITSTHDNYDLSFSGNDLIINLEQNYNGVETVNLDCNGISSSFLLTINPINDPPTIDSYNPQQDQTIQENNSQEFSIQASDIDNDDLTIKWYVDDIEVGIGDSYNFNTDYSSSDNSPYRIKVIVTDENNEYVSHNWILTVLNTNRAPISHNIDNIITQENTPIEINLNCEDPENDILSYEIVNDVIHGSTIINNNIITYTPEQNYNSQDSFSYRCSDGRDFSNNAVVSITITSINNAPIISNLSDLNINEDTIPPTNWMDLWSYTNDVDNTNDELTFSIKSQSNPSLINCYISSSRYFNCDTPTLNQFGTSNIIIEVSDGEHRAEDSFTISVLSVNDDPVANNIISNTNENAQIIVTLDYNDIDLNDKAESCSILNIIDGTISQPCACNNGICTVGLTPLTNSVADISANYIVNDGNSDSNIATITVSINSIDDPAVWQTLSNKEINENSPDNTIVYQDLLLKCTDIDSPINMQVTSTHNNYDLSFSGNDLVINNLEQDYNGAETVSLDCNGISSSFVLTVIPTLPVNNKPTITSTAITTAIINQPYIYDVDATDLENDDLNYSLTNAPAGMTINSETGLINWVPTSLGLYTNIIVQVEDTNHNTDTQTFSINVVSGSQPQTKEYKKKHLFSIGSISLPTNTYYNGDTINGFIQIRNIGQLKEKNIEIIASIPDLDIETIVAQNLKLGPYDNKWIPLELELPDNLNQKEYLLRIDIINKNHKDVKYIPIYINDKYVFNF